MRIRARLLVANLVHFIVHPRLKPKGLRGRLWWWAMGVKIEAYPVQMLSIIGAHLDRSIRSARALAIINGEQEPTKEE